MRAVVVVVVVVVAAACLVDIGCALMPRIRRSPVVRRGLALRAEPSVVRRKKTRGEAPAESSRKKKSRGTGAGTAPGAPEPPSPPPSSPVVELAFDFVNGGAYVLLSTTTGSTLRLLVDSGASLTSLSLEAASATIVEPLRLRATVAPPNAFPKGVDGILGFDLLSQYKACEFDWIPRTLRLHAASYGAGDDTPTAIRVPMTRQSVGLGALPMVAMAFSNAQGQTCAVDGVVDTGSPITIVTPELVAAAGLERVASEDQAARDVVAVGVNGQPTTLEATRATRTVVGSARGEQQRVIEDALVYAGTVPMMAAVGWDGKPTALVGLDFLASDGAAQLNGKLVLDFERGEILIEKDRAEAPKTAALTAVKLDAFGPIVGEKSSLRPSEGTFVSMKCRTRQGDLLMLVDTAATGVVVTLDAAARLGLLVTKLDVEGAVNSAGGTTKQQQPTVTTLDDLELGGNTALRLPKIGALVQEMGVFSPPLDGILGLDVLERFAAVDIDYRTRRFVFHATPPPAVAAPFASTALRRTALGVLATTFALNDSGKTCDLIVDTGAPFSLLDDKRADPQLNLATMSGLTKVPAQMAAVGIDGNALELSKSIKVKTVRFSPDGPNLLLNGDEIDLDVGNLPVLAALNTDADAKVAGVLGTDILLREKALRLDFRNGQLILF